MAAEDNPKVVYDVGDLLDRMGTRIDQGFATITAKLDNKADKSDLAAINARLDEHGKEIGRLKEQQRQDDAASYAVRDADRVTGDARQRKVNVALSFALVAVSLLGVLTAVFHW